MNKEIPGLVMTASRYAIAEHMARRVSDEQQIIAEMASFIVADIADGAVLRQIDRDTSMRRIADGVVDHLAVARVAFEAAKKYPETRPYIAALAGRAVLVGYLNYIHLHTTGEATKGGWNQKATNLAMAAFVLVAQTGNSKATNIAGGIASVIAFGTSFAHLKDLGLNHPENIRCL